MTHSMTRPEKQWLLNEVRELAASDIIQREDMIEIAKVLKKAVDRTLAAIDDPYPVNVQKGAEHDD